MLFDLKFLQNKCLLTEVIQGHVTFDGTDVDFHYCLNSRILFIESNEQSGKKLFDYFSSILLFDYLWINDSSPKVFRTFGNGRYAVITESDHSDLLSEFHIHNFPSIFENNGKHIPLRSMILKYREKLAENLDTMTPYSERLLQAQELINKEMTRIIAESVSSSSRLIELMGYTQTKNRLIVDILTEFRNELVSFRWTLDPMRVDNDTLSPSIIHWLFETLTCPLLNIKQDENSVSRQLVTQKKNRLTGSYYTPEYPAHYITSRSLNLWLSNQVDIDIENPEDLLSASIEKRGRALQAIKKIRVVDPAVGAGVFLISAGEWIERARVVLGDSKSKFEIRREIVSQNLYGVDIMEDAVETCRNSLLLWQVGTSSNPIDFDSLQVAKNIRPGNSLIGQPDYSENGDYHGMIPFHWPGEYPEVFSDNSNCGFDVLIGNPPYGNLISDTEKKIITDRYVHHVSGGRDGTWNIASAFIVRALSLLKQGGQFGFLLPNSILRVGQFKKTRRFIANHLRILEIVDEGSPFDDVTLEMVSILGESIEDSEPYEVKVIARRQDIHENHYVPITDLVDGGIFVLYHDDLYSMIKKRCQIGLITAGRGKDIPHEHVSNECGGEYIIPYATKGRSIKRYKIDQQYLLYSNDWFKQDTKLLQSYDSRFLIAAKNFPYPRCVLKPEGILHGGGTVQIRILDDSIETETLGLILNSRMIRYICTKYLTNASELTTCLNTGIMSELPIALPEDQEIFSILFKTLQALYERTSYDRESVAFLDSVANALVYSLYLSDDQRLAKLLKTILDNLESTHGPISVHNALLRDDVKEAVESIMQNPVVKKIEESPLMIR